MWPNPQFTTDLVMFTEEIFNGKLYFCTVNSDMFTTYDITKLKTRFLLVYFISEITSVCNTSQ